MNKVITIHLNGKAYQIEESGYQALQQYLEEAKTKLEGNPDKSEIVGDFEQAIADKCERYLNANKTVVLGPEVETILKEMGPVNTETRGDEKSASTDTATENSSHAENKTGPKRLYRIKEGSMVSGVCKGLAVYFDIDVTIVRILFVVLALVTKGTWGLVYAVMMFVVPPANTAEKRANAYGTTPTPVTAQDLLDRAKDGYQNFKNSKEWRQWKQQMKQETRRWKQEWKNNYAAQRYDYSHPSPFMEVFWAVWGLFWTVLIVFAAWWGYYHIPVIHDFLNQLSVWLEMFGHWFVGLFKK